MSNNPEQGEGLSKPDRIDAIIEAAFDSLTEGLLADLQAEYDFEKIDTESGAAIRCTVHSHIGSMHCLYLLRPAVELLLEKYAVQNGPAAVTGIVLRLLTDLPLATQIGAENAYDSAKLVALEMLQAIASVTKQDTGIDVRKRRTETLKTMNARNATLVEPPKTGPQADVSLERLSAAVGLLMREGQAVEQITAMALANKLGCEENSIHQALKRQGSSLKDFLSRFSGLVDN